MTWPYRTYRPERAGRTNWKRIFALPLLVTSIDRWFCCLVGKRPARSLLPDQAPCWLTFPLIFIGGRVVYRGRFRAGGDPFDSRGRALYLSYTWCMRARWLPPKPLGFVEYLAGRACFTGASIAAIALAGIDLEQE